MKKQDQQVLALLETVRKKKSEIERAQKPAWNTNCTIGYNPDIATDRINLQTVTDIRKLIDLHSFLLAKKRGFEESSGVLGVNLTFSYMGYSFLQWEGDIKTRVSQVNLGAKRKELEALEKRLDGLITVEQRRVLELEEISKILS